jgi:DNA-binding transcriptional ArsR family regulator
MRIVSQLRQRPLNAYQLSINLDLNYKAIQHHLKVLESNNLVIRIGGKYGAAFFISPFLEVNFGAFDSMVIEHDKELLAPMHIA